MALLGFFGTEGAAQPGTHAEDRKQTWRNHAASDALRIAAHTQADCPLADHRDVRKAAALFAQIAKLRRRNPVLIVRQPDAGEVRPDLHQALGVWIRQRLEQ